MRCLQDSTIAPGIISRARYLVTLARLVFAPAVRARIIAIIDPKLPALDLLAAGAVDDIIANGYIPQPGRNALFISLAPFATDQLFVARLLLRPEIYKAALLEDFPGADAAAPVEDAGDRLAQAANKLWLKRYDILLPYAAPDAHPEVMARDIWQTIAAQMQRAALPQFAVGGARPRIALISPLPPSRSGIADYSASLAGQLARRAEISLFSPEPGGGSELISHLPYIARRFDRVISVMGNNAYYHGGIYDLLLRYGGACICHDARLSGFYEQKFGTARMAALATAEIGKPVGQEEVASWLQDETLRGADFLDEIATASQPLILHSYQSAEALMARGFANVRYLPFAIYRPWDFGALAPAYKQKARERVGVSPDQALIISLGFITETKGIEPALQAMVLLRGRGIAASLVWVGQAHTDMTRWRSRAAELGVADYVKFLDQFIDEASYRDYLLAADAALQLRASGSGNISGALQDCISAGLPAVANADLAAALNAPFYVTRIGDRLDPDEIAVALAALLAERPNTDFARADYTTARGMPAYADGLCKLLELD
jgi:glycosyltransferase involved in cell wall biosynthesis